jgi:hypothetical protein
MASADVRAGQGAGPFDRVERRAAELIDAYLDGGNSSDTLFVHFHGDQASASAGWIAQIEALLDRLGDDDTAMAVHFSA